MRPSLSLRAILVIALLFIGTCARASSCASPQRPGAPAVVPLEEAIRRTVAAGSFRFSAELTSEIGSVAVRGVTSLREARSATIAEAPGSPAVEVRVNERGAWLRSRPDAPWTPLDPAAVATAGVATDWGGVLRTLRAAGPPHRRTLRATHDGAPATVDLDDVGRIARLRITKPPGHLDLRVSDHGAAVVVPDP